MRRSRLKRLSGTNNFLRKIRESRGIVLPVFLALSAIFALEVASISEFATTAVRQMRSMQHQVQELYVAEAATDKVMAAIKQSIATTGAIPGNLNTITTQPNTNADSLASISNFQITSSNTAYQTLVYGDYAGLNGNVTTVTVQATSSNATAGIAGSNVTVTQTYEIQQIPIFQFGVFYNGDLEILPGPNMTFAGPVHTNGNLYLGTHNNLYFNSQITAHGDIFHGRKDSNDSMLGNVYIKDSTATNQNMSNGGGSWLDSNAANWLLESQNRWDGNVKSGDHGIEALNIPLPSGASASTIIDRRAAGESSQVQAQKMDYKAQIRIIDGVTYNQAGSALELRYCSGGGVYNGTACPGGQTLVNPITSTTFYNHREGKTIYSTDINVGLLNSSPNFQSLVSANNGIVIYASDYRNNGAATQQGLRLTNGSTLPVKGMTVASDRPVYVKGDYNTVSKKPSSVIGDAVTIQSNAWNDANSSLSISNRVATQTTVNTTLIAGNTNTAWGSYNGGFENLMRFQERWSGVNLNYTGSVINLYNSRVATGNWVYGGNYYEAPNRNWGFDTDLSNPNYNVPGLPSVYYVTKATYEKT